MALPSDPRQLDRLAASFRALGHPVRLRILDAMRDGSTLSPTQVLGRIGPATSLPNLAYHTRELAKLECLKLARLEPARGALEHFYRLSPRGRELLALAEVLCGE